MNKKKKKMIDYGRYGYFFIAPFFITYLVFQLWPLINTFYYSTLSYYKRNGREFMEFAGLQNFVNILGMAAGERGYVLSYLKNTLVMWGCNFVPQILVSLLLAVWLTDEKVKVKGTGAMKVIVYLPSVITAASVSVLFKSLFSQYGPITQTLKDWGVLGKNFDFMSSVAGSRGLSSTILWWMWFGNTTIVLMAGIMGIDPALYEASAIDGASAKQQFRRITMPMLKPIMLYVMITSMIGGLQLFDIPNLIVNRGGTNGVASTVVMDISTRINSSQGDMGVAGAESVVLFLAAGLIGIFMFRIMQSDEDKEIKAHKKAERKARKQAKGVQ